MNYSPYQKAWLADWLTLSGHAEDTMAQTIASAKVDMNPHQIEAAMFALASPLSNGCILADEVGLGKTIEASLILTQKWAERKRYLLLIVPATLRKQWSQELLEKFSIPTIILEAKNFNQTKKKGYTNPFDLEIAFQQPAICICSYEFAARKEKELSKIKWDLVVLDEAHKLRNVYKKDGSKIAKKLEAALIGCKKILLSATPLQNSLLELYGLVSIIDPHFFGDLDSFKAKYSIKNIDEPELASLRQRLRSVCHRTLRRQVQKEGGYNFTKRYSITEDFSPSKEEETLYTEVSNYLQQEDLLAIKPGARHLVTLVIRKILASSSYALEGTLQTMIQRLENKLPLIDALSDLETLADYQDEDDIQDEDTLDPLALKAEIDLLKGFQKTAVTIKQNAKAEALLRVLGRAFERTQELGGLRKAVIFTESVRTQAWLSDLLSKNGFNDQTVLLNGSNNDKSSKVIYKEWLTKHQGSSKISGSKSADMKAALVEKFKNDATIMISTEAGAEGINLQFCSLLINYDLPWNPQRVEQRIGRIHRYGQKYDVVVVNFINKGNRADERVFELLSEKFQLFEGVFGASDEVLGSIESGVDIERRIHDIYQRCRTNEQIELEFDALQSELREQLDAKEQDARRSLLENFDTEVIKRLSSRRGKISQQLNAYHQRLMLLATMSLSSSENPLKPLANQAGFIWNNQRFLLNWQLAEETDGLFFRPQDGLGAQLIYDAKQAALPLASLRLVYASQEGGQWVDIKNLIGQSGYLQLTKAITASASETREKLLLVGITEADELLHTETVERLLQLPLIEQQPPDAAMPEAASASIQGELYQQLQQFKQQVSQDNENYYQQEVEKLERWAEDKRVALDLKIKQLDQEIKEAKKASRTMISLQEKMQAKREIKKLERQRDEAMLNYHEERKSIEYEEDRLLDDIEGRLTSETRVEKIFTIQWTLYDNQEV